MSTARLRRESRVYAKIYSQSFHKFLRAKMRPPILVKIMGTIFPWIRTDWENRWMLANEKEVRRMARIASDVFYDDLMGGELDEKK